MRVRWTAEAASDLEQITNYLFDRTPANAAQIAQTIYDTASKLTRFPLRGRPGRKVGTRELVVQSTPYVIVYQAISDGVRIARILHGARKWP